MRFAFTGYGLNLQANQPIPGLLAQASTSVADVIVCLGESHPDLEQMLPAQEQWYVSSYTDDQGVPGLRIWKLANGEYFRLRYVDGNEFLIDRSGTQVWVTWPAHGTLREAVSFLLGPILGFILRLRGVTCLHASAIAVGDLAVAFIGPERAGKSTTAAAFAGRGYPVLADDIVALSAANGTFLAQPGCPRLRLWPSSIDALAHAGGRHPDSLPADWGNKRYYLDLTNGGYEFQRRALPLAAVYVLGERSIDEAAPFVEELNGGAALINMISNTYAARLLDSSRRAQEFALLDRLVNHVPVRRVNPHAAPDQLAKLCDVLLRDFQALISKDAAATRIA